MASDVEDLRSVPYQRRLQLLVDAVVDYAIYVLDTGGHVTSWNPGAQRIKGYSADEIVGEHYSRFFTEEEKSAGMPMRALHTAKQAGRYEAEGWRIRKDGSRFWALVVIDAIRDEAGNVIGFAKVTRDMTERRNAQEALEKVRDELRQAQKMEALGHLTGGVAHDFNNVLTAIIANLELIRARGALDQTAKRQIDGALKAAENGAAVVRQMLVFARMQPMQPVAVDVNQAVEEIVELLQQNANENIDIRTKFAPDLKRAKADPSQLRTNLLNLGLNAIDAMPSGGLLSIIVRQREVQQSETVAAGEYISIVVSDTGTGMTPEALAHAFEPFFTTKEMGKGTGLGLSTVHGAVRQLGGDVTISTERDKGTSVEILLPAAIADCAAESAEQSETDTSEKGKAMTVLYVEDDFLVAMATLDTLESSGLRVLSAARAEEALELLQRHPEIDLMLTDIGLPDMNGHDLVAEARRCRPDLKVMFLTGYDRVGPKAVTETGGTTKYLDKPYDPATLIRLVRDLAAAPSLAGAPAIG